MAGCATKTALPWENTQPEQILRELAARDSQIETLTATATAILTAPDIEGKQLFQARIQFARPDRLRIQGKHKTTGVTVFELVSVGEQYHLSLPREGRVYSGSGDETTEGLVFAVAPKDIARELLFPVNWAEVEPEKVRLVRRDAGTGRLTLEWRQDAKHFRQVVVGGEPWVLYRSVLLNRTGEEIATTERSAYNGDQELLFPHALDAHFPAEETRLQLRRIRNIRFNKKLADEVFEIES
jgi:hypothetical protein